MQTNNKKNLHPTIPLKSMKHTWLICIFYLLLSCNDGDIIEKTFDFTNSPLQKCETTNALYKIKNQDALRFNINENTFPQKDTTITLKVNDQNKISYHKYNTPILLSTICTTTPPPSLETWNAIGGTITIKSTKIIDTNNPTKTIAYNHNITFTNLSFSTPKGQIAYNHYNYGNYIINTPQLNLDFNNATLQHCPNNHLLYKYNATTALLLTLDPSLYNHKNIGTKNLLISSTNQVSYRIYNNSLNTTFFCQAIPPTQPAITEEWTAENGIPNKSGIISIETTPQTTTTYKHTIKLINITLKKGNTTYTPSEKEYIVGEIIN